MAVPTANRIAVLSRPAFRADDGVLERIDRPVLGIHGRQDIAILPAASERVAEVVPGARLRLYDECGHAPLLEQPERFKHDLTAFIG
jgi:pimeloyl-ACP methyl ester carboxylesterase